MLTEDQIAALEQQHGKVRVYNVTLADGTKEAFAFAFPSRGQFKMWRAAEKNKDPDAQERLVIGMCKSHSLQQFSDILDKPGNAAIADVLAGKLTDWLLPNVEEQGKG